MQFGFGFILDDVGLYPFFLLLQFHECVLALHRSDLLSGGYFRPFFLCVGEMETGKDTIQVHLSRFLHDVYVCYEHSVLLLGDGLFVCEVLDLVFVGWNSKEERMDGWEESRYRAMHGS